MSKPKKKPEGGWDPKRTFSILVTSFNYCGTYHDGGIVSSLSLLFQKLLLEYSNHVHKTKEIPSKFSIQSPMPFIIQGAEYNKSKRIPFIVVERGNLTPPKKLKTKNSKRVLPLFSYPSKNLHHVSSLQIRQTPPNFLLLSPTFIDSN